ncbi:protein shisa-like-1 isoform X2 [Protopterus annectens]|uniref:protein shisa-like-1 isoform X2 n=1 Tax=Protopterus annectens TaxID=7888 RepID=UPI001CFC3282|nr:protein shisa-like-1 isoform X2 [Protopterus annectens]
MMANLTSQSSGTLAVVFMLISSTALSAHFRVCEPYTDSKGQYHSGFHCPRLSDNKFCIFCCHHNNSVFKYCCNDTEFQTVMLVNITGTTDGYMYNNYNALVGVWIYGFFVTILLMLDFLYYSAMNYEICKFYLAKWGIRSKWLKHGQSDSNSPVQSHNHSEAQPQLEGITVSEKDVQSPALISFQSAAACISLQRSIALQQDHQEYKDQASCND